MKKILKISLIVIVSLVFLCVAGGAIAFSVITKDAKINKELLPQSTISTVFYDINGNIIEGNYDDFINYDEIPDNLINAVISLEDKRFYSHKGVDYIRVAGALKNNIKNKGFYEGGSTITQQLIKNTHLSQDKTVNRKLNEIKLAKKLEKDYEKNEIITMYLNVVYFGNGMYGVKSAAKGLFNKNVNELSLTECATLAAILKNPSKYSPIANIENSTSRRNLVLRLMCEQGYISEQEKDLAVNTVTVLDRNATYSNTQSYVLSAAYEAAQKLNISVQTLMSSGYKIYTYLNPDEQEILTNVIGNPSYYLLNDNGVRGEGMGILMDNYSNGITAFFSTKKRNIYDFVRPFGSIVKPVMIYAPAFENGLITVATPVLDEKTNFSGYEPSNYNDNYLGWIDIRTAIKTSSNVAAVKTYNMVGFDKVKAFCEKINISLSESDNNATMALGNLSGKNNLLSILGAYGAMANCGDYSPPAFVNHICDKNRFTIYKHEILPSKIMSGENAYLLTNVLIDTAKSGTAKGLNGLEFEVAAKTGTVGNNYGNTDAYNVGYTTKQTYLVWHGNSTGDGANNLPLKETGGSYVTRSAKDILKNINTDKPNPFIVPDNIIYQNIDTYCLKNKQLIALSTENTPDVYVKKEVFDLINRPNIVSNCFDNFTAENVIAIVENKTVKIQFKTEPYLFYEIVRKSGKKHKTIKIYTPNSGDVVFTDYFTPTNQFVKYSIKPYFYNRNGKKIDGIPYNTDNFYIDDKLFNHDFDDF